MGDDNDFGKKIENAERAMEFLKKFIGESQKDEIIVEESEIIKVLEKIYLQNEKILKVLNKIEVNTRKKKK